MIRTTTPAVLTMLASLATLCSTGCRDRGAPSEPAAAQHEPAAAPTNRVDIPDGVRRNLGVTFAKVESRSVARTLRVPGRFEPMPTARREYRAPLAGRIELLVTQYQRVEAGAPLYRIDAPAWRGLAEEIIAVEAKVASMGPLREAHRVHERSLADKVALWKARLTQLDELRAAGGGSAAQFTDARATLNATQAELADVMETDAALQAEDAEANARLRGMQARRAALLAAGGCPQAESMQFVVCAVAAGVVASIDVTQGGLVADSANVVEVVQPEQVRFRARALQGDLGRLRDGLPSRVVAPNADGSSVALLGTLAIGIAADPDGRTIDLVFMPSSVASGEAFPWARAGVAASLEVTLDFTPGQEAADSGQTLAIPMNAVVRDGITPIIFRRDPKNPDKAIRLDADLGVDDGRWVVIKSGVKEGDEIVVAGNFQLMLATSGIAAKGGHFHSDGTFHEGKD